MPKGVLIDLTKCDGCRSCQVACKRWNDLPAEKTSLSPEWTNPQDFSPSTWTYVKFRLRWDGGRDVGVWRFGKLQCLHCLNPSCIRVCPVKAITKHPEGPVIIDVDKCIGCRYCIAACPFNVPRYDPKTNKVYKCWMCADRLKEGGQPAGSDNSSGYRARIKGENKLKTPKSYQHQPACASTCPTGALEFGDRDSLLSKAKSKSTAIGGYVYGDNEVGGTTWLYVSDVPLTEIGLPETPEILPLQVAGREILKPVTGGIFFAVLLLAAGMALIRRRAKVKKTEERGEK